MMKAIFLSGPRMYRYVCSKYNHAKHFHVSSIEPDTQFLQVAGKNPIEDRDIAYKQFEGIKTPGIIYIPGFLADKSATKALSLDKFCKENGYPYLRYDPTSRGESKSKIKTSEARLSHWIEDAEAVLNQLTEGPQLIVGSSMGAWISTILTQRHPQRIKSLLLLAPALNLTKGFIQKLPEEYLKRIKDGETLEIHKSEYGPVSISMAFLNDMTNHEVDLSKGGCNVTCPIRIIHGTEDKEIPYGNSIELIHAFKSDDVQLKFLKNIGHNLSDNETIGIIHNTILDMTSPLPKL